MPSACAAASISCTRFLYSIFLALLRPCVLRGGSDPASQGLICLSPSSKCALCPASGPTPTTPPASPSWLTGCPPPAQQVPSLSSAHGTVPPSIHNFLGMRGYRARSGATLGSGAAFCHLAGGAMTQSLTDNVMSPAACGNLLCSLASWWGEGRGC